MNRIALVPLLALLIVPLGLQAQPQDEEREKRIVLRFDDPNVENWVERLQDRTQGARLGVGVGDWADGAVEGITVTSVSPGGPAEQAGLRTGDLLTAIDGATLAAESGPQSFGMLRNVLDETEPGSDVLIGYRRGEADLEVQVTTSTWENIVVDRPHDWRNPRFAERVRDWANRMSNWDSGSENFDVEVDEHDGQERQIVRVRRGPVEPLAFFGMSWSLVGLQIAELTPELGEYFGTENGLLVVRGPDNEDIGLEDGDVIQKIGGRAVDGARRATRILRSYEPGEEVEMEVLRHKRRKTISFELPERSREGTRGHFMAPPARPAAPDVPARQSEPEPSKESI